MRIQNKTILASILLVLISFVSVAQETSVPQPPAPPPPPGLPIDTALPYVLVMAIVFGIVVKVKQSKKQTI